MDEKIVKDSQSLVKDLVNDTISRRAAIDALCEDYCGGRHGCKFYPECENLKPIQQLPSAQPERKRGTWIPVTNGRGGHECSLCHTYAPSFQTGDEWLTDYCPTCGACMQEVKDDA